MRAASVFAFAAWTAVSAMSVVARADGDVLAQGVAPASPGPAQVAVAPPADAVAPAKADPWADVRRPWLYTADPSAPPPLRVLAFAGAGYAAIDRGAARPFAADVAHAGAVFNAGAELGLVRVLSVEGQVLLAGASPQTKDSIAAGGMVGLTLHPLPARWPVQAAVSSGYLRELGGDNGLWGRVAIATSLGRLRLGGTALVEHMFAAKRDPADLMLSAGASVTIVPWAALGLEYVAQDLEELGDEKEGVDGGLRHFVGLTASLTPVHHLQITAGPALGLSQGAPGVLGRGQVSYYF